MCLTALTGARGGRDSPGGKDNEVEELHSFDCCVSSGLSLAVCVGEFGYE